MAKYVVQRKLKWIQLEYATSFVQAVGTPVYAYWDSILK